MSVQRALRQAMIMHHAAGLQSPFLGAHSSGERDTRMRTEIELKSTPLAEGSLRADVESAAVKLRAAFRGIFVGIDDGHL